MMKDKICIDAGPVIRLALFPEEENIRSLWEQWEKDEVIRIAPALLYYEVTNVLFRYLKQKIYTPEMIYASLEAALALPIILLEDPGLHRLAVLAARRFNLKAAYDAHYLALAEREGIELWTTDKKLKHQVQASGVDWVRLIG
jgi:predicted nucleic acid-binding protein